MSSRLLLVFAAAVAALPCLRGASVDTAWDVSSALRGSIGWRQNATVSAFNPVDRAFWRTEAEAFVLRPFAADWTFLSFLTGDVLRYVDAPADVPGEQSWIGHLETRWQAKPWARLAVKADGFAETTFIDPSQTEGTQLPPVRVRVRGGYGGLAARLSLRGGFSFEPFVQVRRLRYRDYNGHYDELRPGARIEWSRHERLTLSAGFHENTRHYTELTQSTAGGRPLPGRLLSLKQREAELKAVTRFKARGTWTLTAAVSRLENRDQAFGYLDYNQRRAAIDVGWEHGRWRASVAGDMRRVDYRVQRVGVGTVRPARVADITEASARVERDVSERWAIFAETRWEKNESNVRDEFGAAPFDYQTATSLLGLERRF